MNRPRLLLGAALLALVVSACIPVSVPGLRNIDGQTWSARFDVDAQLGTTTVRLPMAVSLTFEQQIQDVAAEATIEYDAGIVRLSTGNLVSLDGFLGFDDRLELDSPSRAFTFTGRFVGDRLVGNVAIAGVVPVGDVTFTRAR